MYISHMHDESIVHEFMISFGISQQTAAGWLSTSTRNRQTCRNLPGGAHHLRYFEGGLIGDSCLDLLKWCTFKPIETTQFFGDWVERYVKLCQKHVQLTCPDLKHIQTWKALRPTRLACDPQTEAAVFSSGDTWWQETLRRKEPGNGKREMQCILQHITSFTTSYTLHANSIM